MKTYRIELSNGQMIFAHAKSVREAVKAVNKYTSKKIAKGRNGDVRNSVWLVEDQETIDYAKTSNRLIKTYK